MTAKFGRGGRYTADDDRWIVEYFGAVSERDIAGDIGRSPQSIRKRAAHLKKTGAWGAYVEEKHAGIKAGILAGRLDPDMMETIHGYTMPPAAEAGETPDAP